MVFRGLGDGFCRELLGSMYLYGMSVLLVFEMRTGSADARNPSVSILKNVAKFYNSCIQGSARFRSGILSLRYFLM